MHSTFHSFGNNYNHSHDQMVFSYSVVMLSSNFFISVTMFFSMIAEPDDSIIPCPSGNQSGRGKEIAKVASFVSSLLNSSTFMMDLEVTVGCMTETIFAKAALPSYFICEHNKWNTQRKDDDHEKPLKGTNNRANNNKRHSE